MSEIYVSPDASDESGDGSSQNPFKSLGFAINNSEDGSTIYLNDGEYVGENNRNIQIDKSVTIIGKSKQTTLINGESAGRLFNLNSAGRLTLINITLINGYLIGNGGVIYNDGGEINIKNCIFKNSSAYGNGGVIYNNLGTLNIENSFFINNSARYYGGVLYTLGTTSVKNSNFTENVLISYEGVGACIAAGGKIDLDGCLFYKCYTTYSAAALLNLGNATINNCRFERLTTNYTAGAISNHKYMIINNSYFGYNEVQYYAAAILAPPSGQHVTTIVYNTIFEKNHAGNHAAVSNNFKNTELYMENCAIVDNYIKLYEAYGDISLDDNATIQYCWWGQNEISSYYYSPHSGDIRPDKINASRWLVMTFTSNNGAIYKDEINQLTVSLKHYFDNDTKEIYEYDGEFDLPLDVTFFTDAGTLATKKLVNGVATFDFYPQNGIRAVYARINNQTLKLDDFQSRRTNIVVNFENYYGSNNELILKLIKDSNAPISNENVAVSLGGTTFTVKTDKDGQIKLSTKGLSPNDYTATVTFAGSSNYFNSTASVNVVIKKATPKISANSVSTVYNGGKYLVVTLTDVNGDPIVGKNVSVNLNGVKTQKTDENGQVKFTTDNLAPKTSYAAEITVEGDENYTDSSASAKITVKKATPKLTAGAKTFKRTDKTKKYTVTLKTNQNKVMKNAKVTITVGKKTYTARTDSKGVATFKLAKLTKSGKYTAKVKFAATSYYNAKSASVKITVK
ncbi:MAG: hypothetical protein IJF83_12425 [Methanobrevibacter sp.]|nr:hypothetical protein [Methanobrevibacter sp.]